MTYGHAERNLACIRQLEAESRQLGDHSADGRVPSSEEQLPNDDEAAGHIRAVSQAAGQVLDGATGPGAS